MPLAHLLRCERASFEKARSPEPFVNANAFHRVELVLSGFYGQANQGV
jgi:hypothetical protein